MEAQGYAVAQARNGQEALDYLRGRRPLPHAILLDLMMPVMNGWQFLAEVERDPELAGIPVIVTSGSASEPTDGS